METTDDTTQTHPEPRRLTRSRERIIGGVGGGLGRYFGIDPIIFRIGLVALTVFGGAGLFVYIAALLFVPAEGSSRPAVGVRLFRGDRAVLKKVGLIVAVIVGSGLLAVGSAWATGMGSGTAVAAVVIVLGVALVVGAFRGGARWLVLPALAVALPAGVVSAAGVDFHGGVGDRSYRPGTVSEVHDTYRLGAGRLEVDLRDVRFPAGDHPIELRTGTGEINLIVPKGVCVSTRARIGAGYVGSLDRESGGVDVDWTDDPPSSAGAPRLVVDGDVGLGALLISDRPVGDGGQDFRPGLAGTNDACRTRPARR
jgi:phage shock protein PspC (stress-responsive transcriptional regulator)